MTGGVATVDQLVHSRRAYGPNVRERLRSVAHTPWPARMTGAATQRPHSPRATASHRELGMAAAILAGLAVGVGLRRSQPARGEEPT